MTTVQPGPATLAVETRSPGAVRANRVLLALLGLVLALLGLATLALGTGLLNPPAQDQPVLNPVADAWVAAHSWIWWPIAVGGVLVALVCLRWLLAQAGSNRVSRLDVGERTEHGRTTVAAGALTAALEREVEDHRGVQRARAHLTGTSTAPALSLSLALDGRVPVDQVLERITAQTLPHARQALTVDSLPTRVEFTVPRTAGRDVR